MVVSCAEVAVPRGLSGRHVARCGNGCVVEAVGCTSRAEIAGMRRVEDASSCRQAECTIALSLHEKNCCETLEETEKGRYSQER